MIPADRAGVRPLRTASARITDKEFPVCYPMDDDHPYPMHLGSDAR